MLTVTEILRQAKVVGKFVEFCGEGTRTLALPDRATIANMAPEYGATMGFFPVDDKTISYFKGTGRTAGRDRGLRGLLPCAAACSACRARPTSTTAQLITLDLGTVSPSLAGPKRPQDRIELGKVKSRFSRSCTARLPPPTASTSRPRSCRWRC